MHARRKSSRHHAPPTSAVCLVPALWPPPRARPNPACPCWHRTLSPLVQLLPIPVCGLRPPPTTHAPFSPFVILPRILALVLTPPPPFLLAALAPHAGPDSTSPAKKACPAPPHPVGEGQEPGAGRDSGGQQPGPGPALPAPRPFQQQRLTAIPQFSQRPVKNAAAAAAPLSAKAKGGDGPARQHHPPVGRGAQGSVGGAVRGSTRSSTRRAAAAAAAAAADPPPPPSS